MKFSLGLALNEINVVWGGESSNMCFSPLETLPDSWIGYDTAQSPSGTLVPNITADGTIIYAYKANPSDGQFIVSFGNGTKQLFQDVAETLPITLLVYKMNRDNVELLWDDTLKYYTGVDQKAADTLNSNIGNDSCFSSLAIPRLLVWYDFKMEVV